MKRLVLCLLAAGTLVAWQPAYAKEVHKDKCGHRPHLNPSMHEVMVEAQKLMTKNTAKAAELLSAYAKMHPKKKHFKFSFMRGLIAYQRGKLAKAEHYFAHSVKLWPCYVPALCNLAVVKYECKEFVPAAELMIKAYEHGELPKLNYLFQAAAFFFSSGKTLAGVASSRKTSRLAQA